RTNHGGHSTDARTMSRTRVGREMGFCVLIRPTLHSSEASAIDAASSWCDSRLMRLSAPSNRTLIQSLTGNGVTARTAGPLLSWQLRTSSAPGDTQLIRL